MEITCVILAGGKSLRLGRDKLVEKLGTASLLDRVVDSVEPLSDKIIIVTADERRFSQFSGNPKISVTSDIIPGQGSLGGVYTGLVTSGTQYNLVVAADMPFLSRPLLRYMIEASDGFDFILPRVDTLYEPLHAVYSRDCIKAIETIFGQGRKVIVDLFNYVKVRFIDADEIIRYDPKQLSFFNINTLDDLERARKLAGGDCPSC